MKIRWFFLFFFISGFCSLVYEVVWIRLSIAKFGVTTPMVSIVLSIFMAGLGLGSWLGGAVARRLEKNGGALALRLYGAVELLIGISAVVAPRSIQAGYTLLRDLGGQVAWGSNTYYLASGAMVTIALLPWCTCMGATFPFAMAAIRSLAGKESEHSFSYLYLANVLGAVLGTLLPALVLIELYGFHGPLYIACALNVGLAATALTLSFFVKPAKPVEIHAAEKVKVDHRTGVLWMLLVTGLCSMAMEVAWIREYTNYLGNLVYAFATILAIYLIATYAGASYYRYRVRRGRSIDGTAGWIWLGFTALLPLLFADPRMPQVESHLYDVLRAALGIGPFSALAGYLTPMLVDRWSQGFPDRAGRAYAVNVVGSILGPLVGGFLVIPLAGERWGLCWIAIPLFALGFLATARRVASQGARTAFASALVLSLGLAITK